MRKSLYDIIDEYEIDPTKAFRRILYYFDEKTYRSQFSQFGKTLKWHIDNCLFENLPIRKGGQINLDDLMRDIGLTSMRASKTFDDVFLFVEFILCCYDSVKNKYAFYENNNNKSIFSDILECINEILLSANHKIVSTGKGRIVIQEDAAMEQAVELAEDDDVAVLLYKYRHYSNDNDDRRQILVQIIDKISVNIQERQKLKNGRYYDTADTVSNIANNFNVRHNNAEGKDKKEYSANLSEEEQHYWYDSLYNAILILILEGDYRLIKEKIKLLQSS